MSVMLRAWGALATAAAPFVRWRARLRAQREAGFADAFEERFGRFSGSTPLPTPVWVHAVSLGETRAAASLLLACAAAAPESGQRMPRIVLSHGTATGREAAQGFLSQAQAAGLDVSLAWQPWDSPAAVAAFLQRFKPKALWLLETEMWPTALAQCRAAGVRVSLVNARLSAKSLKQNLRFMALAKPAYSGLHRCLAQTESDAQRLRQLGTRVRAVTGNIKFDASPDAEQLALGRRWQLGRPVVMLASSREGEEAQLIAQLTRPRGEFLPSVHANSTGQVKPRWLIVPRHPQRFDEVAALCEQAGLTVSRRSSWGTVGPASALAQAADVWLGDSMGDMALYYAMASVALLGASFARLGGQNLIEALACGCPVVMGPHTFNFADAADKAETQGVALRCADMADAHDTATRLVRDGARQRQLSLAAEHFVQANAGAMRRTVKLLLAESLPN